MGFLKIILFSAIFAPFVIINCQEGSEIDSDDRFVTLYWLMPMNARSSEESTSSDEDVPKDQKHLDDVGYDELPSDRQYDIDQLRIELPETADHENYKIKLVEPLSSSIESSSSSETADRKEQYAFIESEFMRRFMRFLDVPASASDSESEGIPRKEVKIEEIKNKKDSEIKQSKLVKKPTEIKKYPQIKKPTRFRTEKIDSDDNSSEDEGMEESSSDESSSDYSSSVSSEESSSNDSEQSETKDENTEDSDSDSEYISSESRIPAGERDVSESIVVKPAIVPLAPFEDEKIQEEFDNDDDFYFIHPLTPATTTTPTRENSSAKDDESEDKIVPEIIQDDHENSEVDMDQSVPAISKVDSVDSKTEEEMFSAIASGETTVEEIKSKTDEHPEDNEILHDDSEAKQNKDEVTDDKPLGHISFGRLLRRIFF